MFTSNFLFNNLIIMEIMCASVCNQNYVSTNITIPLVIYIFSVIIK